MQSSNKKEFRELQANIIYVPKEPCVCMMVTNSNNPFIIKSIESLRALMAFKIFFIVSVCVR